MIAAMSNSLNPKRTVAELKELRALTGGPYTDTLVIDAYACQTSLTGIAEHGSSNSVSIFPQPANEQLHVQLSQPAKQGTTLVIFDALGQTVQEIQLPEGVTTYEWSTAEFPAGLYQYTLRSGENSAHGKFLVSH